MHYLDILKRVKDTNVLLIDECLILSKKAFETLTEVCVIKNPDVLFARIQIIFCNYHLFRVQGTMKMALTVGETLCFLLLCHTIFWLTQVVRQQDASFILTIKEASEGLPTLTTLELIKALEKPLPVAEFTLKLFATNDLLDDFNRDQILQFP